MPSDSDELTAPVIHAPQVLRCGKNDRHPSLVGKYSVDGNKQRKPHRQAFDIHEFTLIESISRVECNKLSTAANEKNRTANKIYRIDAAIESIR